MAQMYPKKFIEGPKGEERLYAILSTLPDDWMAFHSVKWQSKRRGREGDGETDFMLLHPRHGIIIVEVKGGEIDVRDNVWISSLNGHSRETSNPFEQARDAKYSLLSLHEELGLTPPPINYAVCFPHISANERIGLFGPRPIIWYRNDISNIEDCLRKTNEHWQNNCQLSQTKMDTIKDLLSPTIKIRKKVADEIGDIDEQLLQLTDNQIQGFSCIKRNRRVHVTGAAGTGKTIMACEKTRQLTRAGFKTLFVCYNELLAKHLDSMIECSDVQTYHAFCYQEIRAAGLTVPARPTDEWWESKASEMLIEAAASNNTSYDAVVIDEAQDFSQKWIDSLLLLLSDALDPPVYLFSDSRQDLYGRTYETPQDYYLYDLEVNCRNTNEIAEKVSWLFREEAKTLGVSGARPSFLETNLKREGIECIQSLVGRLIEDDHVSPSQICVLSDDNEFLDRLRETYAGEVAFTKWGGAGVCCESVKRFKGLENDIVIVAIGRDINFEKDLESYYVAFSRPKTHLFVLGSRSFQGYLSWQ